MEIIVNGQREAIEPCTVDELIQQKGLTAMSLIVELNRHIVNQADWPQTHLQENDTLELLNFVGGG